MKEYQPIFEIFFTSLGAFLIHKLAFYLLDYIAIENSFQYQIFHVYSFFLICSIFIVLILIQVKKRDLNNVGNSFLLLTLLKIGIAFIFANPILSSTSKYKEMERMDFFIVFAIFLTIETVVTIRILNNKQ
jgi:predicted MFS family arabinose efflux permease